MHLFVAEIHLFVAMDLVGYSRTCMVDQDDVVVGKSFLQMLRRFD